MVACEKPHQSIAIKSRLLEFGEDTLDIGRADLHGSFAVQRIIEEM